jgi:radical SAM family uncharacterized protein
LNQVAKPSRYSGGEVHAVSAGSDTFNIALCFPDVAEITHSNWGMQVLYAAAKNTQGLDCERAFAVWTDMEQQLRKRRMPLGTLESGQALKEFPLVAFSIPYELMATNVLAMLELGGIPLLASERGENDPIMIAGGHALNNPEPLSMFLDAACIGEGEEMLPAIGLTLATMKGATRQEKLQALSSIPGVYVPSLYREERSTLGEFLHLSPAADAPSVIHRALVADLEHAVYPTCVPVPNIIPVHDKAAVEIMRGCPRRCRFCAAGNIISPVRMRTPQRIAEIARELTSGVGYPEISLLSLNTADYPKLAEVISLLWDEMAEKRVSLSLPSLSVRGLDRQLIEATQKLRGTQLTFAPEAGSGRMRRVIGKGITEAECLQAAQESFAAGADSLKLYFMCGFPGEDDSDLVAIGNLVGKMLAQGGRRASATVNLSVLIPKPHTPFQWAAQPDEAEMLRKHRVVRESLPRRATIKPISPATHQLESAISRGSRRTGEAMLAAYRLGCRFDGWRDQFNPALWQQAFHVAGLNLESDAGRERAVDEVLPWEHIECGRTKQELVALWLQAQQDAKSDEEEPAPKPKPESSIQLDLTIPPELPAKVWWRIVYQRVGSAAFLSVLEMFAMWDKALRRAGLRPSFTQGFNPRPRISLGPALPVGVAGLDEMIDIAFPAEIPITRIKELTLPEGIVITSAVQLSQHPAPPDRLLARETFRITPNAELEGSKEQFARLLQELGMADSGLEELVRWQQTGTEAELTIGRDASGRAPNLRRVLEQLGLEKSVISVWNVTRIKSLALSDEREVTLAEALGQ